MPAPATQAARSGWPSTCCKAGHVLAVAGTHGKTTTTSMLAWMLDRAGFAPGFLVGGVPLNFGVSARLGATVRDARAGAPPAGADAAPFVIEADEYDTAFFDKRSKFVHYRPRTLVLNNLEFDHADIFDDLAAIERQFHHLVRTVPARGRIVVNARDDSLQRVLAQGCWSEAQRFGTRKEEPGALRARGEPHAFDVLRGGLKVARVEWSLLGEHNQLNALAAIGAAEHLGVAPEAAAAALASFENVRRRLELVGEAGGVKVYDDFAHHPTAIRTTIDGLRRKLEGTRASASAPRGRILALFEPRSNTMKLGAMKGAAAVVARGGRPGVLPQRRARMGRGIRTRADGLEGDGRRDDRRGRAPHRLRCADRRPCAVHEQRQLRRHPRQAARCARRARAARSGAVLTLNSAVRLTHLLYLHGFRSSPQSAKARITAAWVARHRADVVWRCPQLPPSPREAMALVESIVAAWPANASGLVGSSLGGFYATAAAERHGLRAALLNPATDPARDLEKYIGETTAWHGEERFCFRPEFIGELRAIAPAAGAHRPGALFRGHRQGRRGAELGGNESALP